uniref:Uncharacterized protein n=1 Tax=Rhizophora mucronata TaxID=61149 RepID=A0A2P2N7C9_RHIMU
MRKKERESTKKEVEVEAITGKVSWVGKRNGQKETIGWFTQITEQGNGIREKKRRKRTRKWRTKWVARTRFGSFLVFF